MSDAPELVLQITPLGAHTQLNFPLKALGELLFRRSQERKVCKLRAVAHDPASSTGVTGLTEIAQHQSAIPLHHQ